MRRALIIGIDHYNEFSQLSGCVNDANAVKAVLERHADGSVNFATPRILHGTAARPLQRAELKEAVHDLFKHDADIALLYFAGHGYIDETGGYLCSSDCRDGADGLSLVDVMSYANKSPARNKVVVLDSCHGGIAGERPSIRGIAEINEGITILTASTADQYAFESEAGGSGIFTNLFVDALEGSAANLVGDVTPGSVYAHIDQSLGPWAQRPVFKTNVKTFVSLRKAMPPISLEDLRALTTHFPSPGFNLKLDPAFEPERSSEQLNDNTMPLPDENKTLVFARLQRYVKVNLVRPVDADHMWHAAIQSKACELTVLGEHYRQLVAKGLL